MWVRMANSPDRKKKEKQVRDVIDAAKGSLVNGLVLFQTDAPYVAALVEYDDPSDLDHVRKTLPGARVEVYDVLRT
jgi:hypothetical protein